MIFEGLEYAEIARLEARIDDLETDLEAANDEIHDLEGEVSSLHDEVFDRDRVLNEAYNRIEHAIDDLNVIGEVPLRDVFDSVAAVVENLRAVLA